MRFGCVTLFILALVLCVVATSCCVRRRPAPITHPDFKLRSDKVHYRVGEAITFHMEGEGAQIIHGIFILVNTKWSHDDGALLSEILGRAIDMPYGITYGCGRGASSPLQFDGIIGDPGDHEIAVEVRFIDDAGRSRSQVTNTIVIHVAPTDQSSRLTQP